MSIFDGMDLENAQAPVVVDANSDVKLRIIGITVDKDKNGLDYIMPRFEISGNDFAKDFTTFLHVPNKENQSSMDSKKFERAKWAMKTFLATFGIDASRPGDPEDWVGQEGWAILGKSDNDEYGEQNFVKKFVAPR